MIYGNLKSLEDSIVELLLAAPTDIKSLHERVLAEQPRLTLRAVYKAVSQLIRSGVLVKAGKQVRTNQEWVRKVQSRLTERGILEIFPGEKATYVFTSLEHLDSFWKTVAFELEEREQDGQIFFYNPHNFWAYVPERRASENIYYRHFRESKIHAFFTVGGESPADKAFKKTYQNEYLQIDTRNISSMPRTDHVTIYGDYVITVRLSRKFSVQMDLLYSESESIEMIMPELFKLPSRAKLSIENNPSKATKLKKSLSLNFYLRKEG